MFVCGRPDVTDADIKPRAFCTAETRQATDSAPDIPSSAAQWPQRPARPSFVTDTFPVLRCAFNLCVDTSEVDGFVTADGDHTTWRIAGA